MNAGALLDVTLSIGDSIKLPALPVEFDGAGESACAAAGKSDKTERKPGATGVCCGSSGMTVVAGRPEKSVTVINLGNAAGFMSSNADNSFCKASCRALSSLELFFSGPPASSKNCRETR